MCLSFLFLMKCSCPLLYGLFPDGNSFMLLLESSLLTILSLSPSLFSHPLVLSIHMDDQIDGKTLIGSYVCTEQPGEFRWQPGSLIQVCIPFQTIHLDNSLTVNVHFLPPICSILK